MQKVLLSIINRSGNPLPAYATIGSSGMDVCAFLEESITINPLERVLVPTGLFLQIPEGYEIQIRPRSGLAFKHGITCLNTPGTIDSDYRGEIKILLINFGTEPHQIQNSDRIAQMVLMKTERASFVVVDTMDETKRGEGGFGHTGK